MGQHGIHERFGGCLIFKIPGRDVSHDDQAAPWLTVGTINVRAPVVHNPTAFSQFYRMKRLDVWIDYYMDPQDQRLAAYEGLGVCDFIWQLTKEQHDVALRVYHDHAAHIWQMMEERAEQYGIRPLQLLDDYCMEDGCTVCSPESLATTCLLWAIEQICKANVDKARNEYEKATEPAADADSEATAA